MSKEWEWNVLITILQCLRLLFYCIICGKGPMEASLNQIASCALFILSRNSASTLLTANSEKYGIYLVKLIYVITLLFIFLSTK